MEIFFDAAVWLFLWLVISFPVSIWIGKSIHYGMGE